MPGNIAHRNDWKAEPMPQQCETFVLKMSFSAEEDIESLNRLLDWWTMNPYDRYGEWLSETSGALNKKNRQR
ncbi:MAG: hypothetical protein K6A14_00170 [Erysipelotrichaceae bacterium]|nr:hypothetical protein [Erysipelotrichaceae bacterium]